MTRFFFLILLIPPLVSALACALTRRRRLFEGISVVSSGLTLAVTFWVAREAIDGVVLSSPQGWFFADALSAYMLVVIGLSAFVVTLYSVGYLRRQLRYRHVSPGHLRLYYSLLHVFVFTMLLVLVSNNLGLLWVGTEATTLATAFLVAFYDRESSIEAAWKYVIICSVGIALALFGIILTYFSALHVVASSASALNWSSLMAVAKQLDPDILKLAFLFAFIGFGTKVGLAPMHTWKPDAYSEAPAPISALMAAGLVNVALYALMRFYALANRAMGDGFAPVLFMVFGLLSMAVAVPFILVQRDFKRLLAYSSVEHAGIIVFALGLGTPLALFGGLLHVLNNALGKLLLFLTAGNVRLTYDSKIMRRITGAVKVIPISATALIVGVFATTGWPPFGTFVSELTIVGAGFSAGHIVPGVVFLFCVTAAFAGFVYYGSGMVFGTPASGNLKKDSDVVSLILLATLAAALLVLGVWIPGPLAQLIRAAASTLQG